MGISESKKSSLGELQNSEEECSSDDETGLKEDVPVKHFFSRHGGFPKLKSCSDQVTRMP